MMRISWGYKIAILYIGFVVMILSLVFGTTLQKSEMVTEDYYQQETVFQKKLDATAAANALHEPLTITANTEKIKLRFPARFSGTPISGKVHFYAPASAASDREFPLQELKNGEWEIARSAVPAGRFEAQVNWTANGTDYYQTIPLTLP